MKGIHPCHVDVEFVDGRFLKARRLFANDSSDEPGVIGVHIHITLNNQCFGAALQGVAHGHSCAHTKAPGLVGAGGHHPTPRLPAHNHGFTLQAAVAEQLASHKKAV